MLVLFPRSNRTEFALYDGLRVLCNAEIAHPTEELRSLTFPLKEADYRATALWDYLCSMRLPVERVTNVFAPAGMFQNAKAGIYPITDDFLDRLRDVRHGEHLLDLGAFVAWSVASRVEGARAFAVESISQDELLEEARLTGLPDVPRTPLFHALSQRGAAMAFAEKEKKEVTALNLIVVHLGREISVGAHLKGRIADVNSPTEGEGPFSSYLAGSLPVSDLANLCFDPANDYNSLMDKLFRTGGVYAHLQTANKNALNVAVEKKDTKTLETIEAMGYLIAKEIGRRAATLEGTVDAILILGPWADMSPLVGQIKERVSWIAPVHVFEKLTSLEMLAQQGRAYLEKHDR